MEFLGSGGSRAVDMTLSFSESSFGLRSLEVELVEFDESAEGLVNEFKSLTNLLFLRVDDLRHCFMEELMGESLLRNPEVDCSSSIFLSVFFSLIAFSK